MELAGKVSGQYWFAVAEPLGVVRSTGSEPGTGSLDPVQASIAEVNAAGAIKSYIHISEWSDALLAQMKELGAVVEITSPELRVVQAWVPVGAVRGIANLPGVQTLDLPSYASSNVTSAGDAIARANEARARFNIDGSGVKVGVISVGIANLSQASAELPGSVTIHPTLSGHTADDEGTAMLEIVHDLAPGASLYFAGFSPSSNSLTSLEMGSAILWMRDQGVNVIVDDLSFFSEPYFTDGAVAQAAEAAVAGGVTYVTAAGNYAQDHYQAQYVQGASSGDGGFWHNFGGGDIAQNVTIPAFGTIVAQLQWSDPWGESDHVYDINVFYAGSEIPISHNVQNRTQDPYEAVSITSTAGIPLDLEIRVKNRSGVPRELELFTRFDDGQQYITPADSIFGQAAVPSVITVGAIDANDPDYDTPESFSSQGPWTNYTNFVTQTKGTPRQVLDGMSIDGVHARIGDLGFAPFNVNPLFFGTSAAAPHVAAIAALMIEANAANVPPEYPVLSPANLQSRLRAGAVDIPASGYDDISGAGRFDAVSAVFLSYIPTQPDLDALSDLGTDSTDNLTADTTPKFTATVPAGSYVQLRIDGDVVHSEQLGQFVTAYSFTTGVLGGGMHSVDIRIWEDSSFVGTGLSIPSVVYTFTIDTTAPKVNQVFLDSSAWTDPDFYNRLVAGDRGTSDGFWIPDGANQLETIWFSNADRIVVQFNENVDVQQNDLSLSGTAASVNGFSYDSQTNTAVWTLDQPIGNENVTLTLEGNAGTAVQDIAGNKLDGEWTNGADAYPSGNGTAAGSFVFNFNVLPADVNQDGSVDIFDVNVVSANWGDPGGSPTGDINGDAKVDIFDVNLISAYWGETNSGGGGGESAMMFVPFHVALAAYLKQIGLASQDKALLAWLEENSAEDFGQHIENIGTDTSAKEIEQLDSVLDKFFTGLGDVAFFDSKTWTPPSLATA